MILIRIRRNIIIKKLQEQPVKNFGGHNNLVNDASNGNGDQAMAYLVKQGKIKFPIQQLESELNNMVEKSMLKIGQWEQMLALLRNAKDGSQRVTNFLRKKRRIVVI